jgi:hypothetical protein
VARDEDFQQFRAHPLGRKRRKPRPLGNGGGKAGRIQPAVAEARRKAQKAQDAQIILADALARIADEAHAAGGEIGEPPDVVAHETLGVERQRVEGEIAPTRVGGEIAAETHFGAPAVGLDILAQRGDLDGPAVEDQRDGAVGDAGGREGDPRRLRPRHHDLGRGGGGEVEIAGRLTEQKVAHRPADEPRLLAVGVEQRQGAGERWRLQRGEIGEPAVFERERHSKRPGTMTPFSRWAGT